MERLIKVIRLIKAMPTQSQTSVNPWSHGSINGVLKFSIVESPSGGGRWNLLDRCWLTIVSPEVGFNARNLSGRSVARELSDSASCSYASEQKKATMS